MNTEGAGIMRSRKTHGPESRDRGYAWTVSILIHGLGITIALAIALQSPDRQESAVELSFEAAPQRMQEAEDAPSGRPAASRNLPPARPRVATQSPSLPGLPDLVVERPPENAQDEPPEFTLPASPLERDWTPEEAYGELTRLLEEYPQFREQVLREMIAGKGFVPDTVQHIELYLDQMLAPGLAPSWGRQRAAVEGAFRSFDGVSGWRQNSNYGGGINVIGLLLFLYDLIEGE
jgi:hypothetical protein